MTGIGLNNRIFASGGISTPMVAPAMQPVGFSFGGDSTASYDEIYDFEAHQKAQEQINAKTGWRKPVYAASERSHGWLNELSRQVNRIPVVGGLAGHFFPLPTGQLQQHFHPTYGEHAAQSIVAEWVRAMSLMKSAEAEQEVNKELSKVEKVQEAVGQYVPDAVSNFWRQSEIQSLTKEEVEKYTQKLYSLAENPTEFREYIAKLTKEGKSAPIGLSIHDVNILKYAEKSGENLAEHGKSLSGMMNPVAGMGDMAMFLVPSILMYWSNLGEEYENAVQQGQMTDGLRKELLWQQWLALPIMLAVNRGGLNATQAEAHKLGPLRWASVVSHVLAPIMGLVATHRHASSNMMLEGTEIAEEAPDWTTYILNKGSQYLGYLSPSIYLLFGWHSLTNLKHRAGVHSIMDLLSVTNMKKAVRRGGYLTIPDGLNLLQMAGLQLFFGRPLNDYLMKNKDKKIEDINTEYQVKETLEACKTIIEKIHGEATEYVNRLVKGGFSSEEAHKMAKEYEQHLIEEGQSKFEAARKADNYAKDLMGSGISEDEAWDRAQIKFGERMRKIKEYEDAFIEMVKEIYEAELTPEEQKEWFTKVFETMAELGITAAMVGGQGWREGGLLHQTAQNITRTGAKMKSVKWFVSKGFEMLRDPRKLFKLASTSFAFAKVIVYPAFREAMRSIGNASSIPGFKYIALMQVFLVPFMFALDISELLLDRGSWALPVAKSALGEEQYTVVKSNLDSVNHNPVMNFLREFLWVI